MMYIFTECTDVCRLKKIGAFAEYAAVDQNAIAKGPAYLSDEEASSVPLTALTALQAPIC